MVKKVRSFIALILVVVMALSLCGITALAVPSQSDVDTQTANQVVEVGGTNYYLADGSDADASDYDVSISKTLSATGTENLFNVDVNVTYKNATTTVQGSDAATTLVIDVSGSMGWNATTGNHNSSYADSRLAAAAAAACAFLDSYAGDGSSDRWVSLVTFAGESSARDLGTAYGNQYWVNVNDETTLAHVKDVINGLQASGGTWTQKGMTVAAGLLNTSTYTEISSISNRFCVLLTDGKPTYYTADNGNRSGDGSDTTWRETRGTQVGCAAVTATGADLYAITYGLSGAVVPVWVNDPNHPRDIDNIEIGTWLLTHCGATAVYPSSSPRDLTNAFNAILNETVNSGSTVSAVVDDMAASYTNYDIDFVAFINQNGATDNGDGTISWNPVSADANPPSGYTSYSMGYQVQLDNTVSGFVAGQAYSLGAATVTFTDVSSGTSHDAVSPAPQVKGYLGSLSFCKVDANNTDTGLSGAQFGLYY